MTGGHKGSEACDARAALVFIIGLAAGTGCTICSKALFQTPCLGRTGKMETFNPPLFQTWLMFLGMSFALPAHYLSEWYRHKKAETDPATAAELAKENKVTARTYMLLGIPSLFDLLATCLMVFGLLHINASIWMLLRGGGIVFVAIMKHFALKDRLKPYMWLGVGGITVAVILVGLSSQIGVDASTDKAAAIDAADAVVGVVLTVAGTFVQSVQYTYEEKVMSGDVSAPPWLLIGVEGVTGTAVCTVLLYPLCWILPGNDHGSFEDPLNTAAKLYNSPTALAFALLFCALVFILNSFSVLVTYMMSSVWHAILDNFRPITIWVVELTLFYTLPDSGYGEAWTAGSWLQLFGMGLLLVSTAVYNGSLKVPGFYASDLIGDNSMMASPALARSPLITHNRSPLGNQASPYVQRPRDGPGGGGPMLGGSSDLRQNLIVSSTEQGRRFSG